MPFGEDGISNRKHAYDHLVGAGPDRTGSEHRWPRHHLRIASDRPGELLERYHSWVTVEVAGLVSLADWQATGGRRACETGLLDRVADRCGGLRGRHIRHRDERAPDAFWQVVDQEKLPRDLSWAFMADAVRFAGLQLVSPVATVIMLYQLMTVFELFTATASATVTCRPPTSSGVAGAGRRSSSSTAILLLWKAIRGR